MKFCPKCGTDLSKYLAVDNEATAPIAPRGTYNQTIKWREIHQLAEQRRTSTLPVEALVDEAIAKLGNVRAPIQTIVHVHLDRSVTPQGGVVYGAAMTEGKGHRPTPTQLQAMGYLVVNEKLVLINDVPVGIGYGVVDYWGGEKQHHRWHLDGPAVINPSRNGDPYFMDDELVAFGARWRDLGALRSALTNLVASFVEGIRGDKLVAKVLALELVPTE